MRQIVVQGGEIGRTVANENVEYSQRTAQPANGLEAPLCKGVPSPPRGLLRCCMFPAHYFSGNNMPASACNMPLPSDYTAGDVSTLAEND